MAIDSQAAATRLRPLLLPLYFPAFLAYLAQGLTASFIVLYAGKLGADPVRAGIIAALPHLGTIFFDLQAGKLSDRYNLKVVFTIGTLLMGLFLVCIGLFAQLAVVVPLLILYGASRTLFLISQVSTVRLQVVSEIRGRALALMGGMIRVGAFVGPAVGGFLAARFGLSSLFVLAGVMASLSALIHFLFAPDSRKHPDGESPVNAGFVAAFRRHYRVLLTAGIGIVVLGVLRSARPVLLPLYGESLGLGLGQIGLIMGLGGLADTLLFYPAGMIYDRFGIKYGAVLCLVLFSVGTALIPVSRGFTSLLMVATLIGIGNGFGAGINMTLSAELAPDNEVGGFLGVWRMFTDAGFLSGPLAIGAITAAAGLASAPVALGIIGLGGALYFQLSVKSIATHPGRR